MTEEEIRNAVARIRELASTASGDLVDPVTKGKLEHAREQIAEIHDLAATIGSSSDG